MGLAPLHYAFSLQTSGPAENSFHHSAGNVERAELKDEVIAVSKKLPLVLYGDLSTIYNNIPVCCLSCHYSSNYQ